MLFVYCWTTLYFSRTVLVKLNLSEITLNLPVQWLYPPRASHNIKHALFEISTHEKGDHTILDCTRELTLLVIQTHSQGSYGDIHLSTRPCPLPGTSFISLNNELIFLPFNRYVFWLTRVTPLVIQYILSINTIYLKLTQINCQIKRKYFVLNSGTHIVTRIQQVRR